jgi:hypothetical protein
MTRLWRWLGGNDGAKRAAIPAGELFHPIAVLGLLLLVVNDRVLKGSSLTGWWTGKLSDVAGLATFPLVVTATLDASAWLIARTGARLDFTLRRWKLAAAIGATGIGFATIKLSATAGAEVAALLGSVFGSATIVPDRTDLIALPALAVAWWIGRRVLARVPLGRIEYLARRARRGLPIAGGLDDVAAAGGSRAACDTLASAIVGGDAAAIDAALAPLRA